MAKRCDICGKGATKGIKRSHSNIKTARRQNLNLQTKKIEGKKMKVCTSCLRNIKKNSE